MRRVDPRRSNAANRVESCCGTQPVVEKKSLITAGRRWRPVLIYECPQDEVGSEGSEVSRGERRDAPS